MILSTINATNAFLEPMAVLLERRDFDATMLRRVRQCCSVRTPSPLSGRCCVVLLIRTLAWWHPQALNAVIIRWLVARYVSGIPRDLIRTSLGMHVVDTRANVTFLQVVFMLISDGIDFSSIARLEAMAGKHLRTNTAVITNINIRGIVERATLESIYRDLEISLLNRGAHLA